MYFVKFDLELYWGLTVKPKKIKLFFGQAQKSDKSPEYWIFYVSGLK